MNHNRNLSVIALLLTFGLNLSAQAGDYNNVVIFGDSLSDGGTYGGNRFTTNPGKTAAEYIAETYGISTTPSNQGGSNYAQGGARVNANSASTPNGFAQRPISKQVTEYLTSTGGKANAGTLYLLNGGANDAFQNMAMVQAGAMTPQQLQSAMIQAGVDFTKQIGTLAATGAKYIVVQNMPNLGITPEFVSKPSAATATSIAQGYNQVLQQAIGQAGLNVAVLDSYGFLGEVVANPAAYGFKNATGVACIQNGAPMSSLQCNATTLISPTAANDYVFADGVHPTTAMQQLSAQYAISVINAPAQVSALSNAPIVGGRDRNDTLWLHNARAVSGTEPWYVFADMGRGKTEFHEGRDQHSSNNFLIGADHALGTNASRLGASIGYQKHKGNFSGGGRFEMTEPTLGVHFRHGLGTNGQDGGVLVQAAYGSLDANTIERAIALGSATRVESGSTKGHHTSVSAQGHVVVSSFNHGQFSHGPTGRIGYEHVTIDGFSESGNSSTAMTYATHKRGGIVAQAGYQVNARYGRVQPYVNLNYEINDTSTDGVSAHLTNTYSQFSSPSISSQSGFRVGAGAFVSLSKTLGVHVGANSTIKQDTAKNTSVTLGVDGRF